MKSGRATLSFEAARSVVDKARRLLQRLGWGVADQGMSSLTNFLVGVIIARSAGPTGYGAFSIAFATYLISLNASRGLATDALLVRYSGVAGREWRDAVAGSTATATAVGLVIGTTCVVIGLAIPTDAGPALVALGLTMPGLLLQDSWRFVFLSAHRGAKTFTNDLLWAVTLVLLLGVAIASGRTDQFHLTLAWGTSATIAAVSGILQARIVPRASKIGNWLQYHRDLSLRYLSENLTLAGGTQLKFYGVGLIAGLTAVGALRAAELLFGPVYVLSLGIALIAVPEAVRLLGQSAVKLRRFCVLISAVGAIAAVTWGMVLIVLLPDGIGERILGSTWDPASNLLIPMAIAVSAIGAHIGAYAGLRALASASRSLLSQGVSSAAYFVATVGGAAASGTVGAAWGFAASAVVSTSFFWWQFHQGMAERPQPGGVPRRGISL